MQRRNTRRRDQAFHDLDQRLQRVLIYLSRVLLLRRNAVRFVAWPEGASDQTFSSALKRWVDDKFIEPHDERQPWQLFFLGPRGYQRLREANFDLPGERRRPAASTLEGLTIASDFAVGMMRETFQETRIAASGWQCWPFEGSAPRPDGTGYVIYDIDYPQRVVGDFAFLNMQTTTYVKPFGQKIVLLNVEIDSGTENSKQLVERAKSWAQHRKDFYGDGQSKPWCRVCWIVTGGLRRMNTIWRIWLQHTISPR